ncbi:MAG: HIT family protein [Actinomycetota bacterium]
MSDCIFCSIVSGEAPAVRVYEDEDVLGIMDVHPATRGHVLVIPRKHSIDLSVVRPEDARAVMDAAVKLAGMIRQALRPDGVNLFVASGQAAWQTVFHFHLHVLPRYDGDSLVQPWSSEQPLADPEDLEAVAMMIREDGGDAQAEPGR